MIGDEMDTFDLICHVAFDQPALTRKQRAAKAKAADVFEKYGPDARAVLEALLDKYADQGRDAIGDLAILKLDPFPGLGTPVELVGRFGGRTQFLQALRDIDAALYGPAA